MESRKQNEKKRIFCFFPHKHGQEGGWYMAKSASEGSLSSLQIGSNDQKRFFQSHNLRKDTHCMDRITARLFDFTHITTSAPINGDYCCNILISTHRSGTLIGMTYHSQFGAMVNPAVGCCLHIYGASHRAAAARISHECTFTAPTRIVPQV